MAKMQPNDLDWGESLDAAVFAAFTRKVTMPISSYPAFKLRLIDGNGNIKRQPRTREEKRALSFLDRLALLFKKYNAARMFQVYNDYRLARLNPQFLQAMTRAMALRFTKYYDETMGWEYGQQNIMKEEKIINKKKQFQEEQKKLMEQEKKRQRELQNQLQDFLIELEEIVEEKEGD